MDFDNLIIQIELDEEPCNEAREQYLKAHPEEAEIEKKMDEEFIEEAELNIEDYIRTFKALPTKKTIFKCGKYDTFKIDLLILTPMENKIYCRLKFDF